MSYMVKNISGKTQSMQKIHSDKNHEANNWGIGETDRVDDSLIFKYIEHPDCFLIIQAVGDVESPVVYSMDQNGNVVGLIGPNGDTLLLGGSGTISSNANKLRPIIGTAGDSIMNGLGAGTLNASPLAWALYRRYSADVYWDQRSYANGGYNFGVGGQTSAQILATQLPQIVLRTPQILFVNGGTNDGMASISAVNASVANMIALCNGALDAGVEMIVLHPILPKTGLIAATWTAIHEFNRKLSIYAAATNGVFFIDVAAAMLDPASAAYEPIGGSSAATGSVTQDGLHNSSYGSNAQSPMFETLLRSVARERKPRAINQTDVFSATENFNGNILGSSGLMLGTNGTLNTVANAGIPAGWAVTTTNGLIVTPSIGTSALPMPAGYRTAKFDLSGTASANATLTIQNTKYSATYFNGLPVYGFECVVRCTNLAGVSGLQVLDIVTGGTGQTVSLGSTSIVANANDMESGDYHMFFYTASPIQSLTGNTQHQFQVKLQLANGRTASGSIELMFAGIFND